MTTWLSISKILRVLLSFFVSLLISCKAPDKPVEFANGEHKCSFCMMTIADQRFRSEAITKKGKAYFFDSIECLSAWSQDHSEEIHSAWVGDFLQNGSWIDLKKAYIMQSGKLNSPMGAGLSAYGSEESFKRAKQLYAGRLLKNEELSDFIIHWQKKSHGK